MLNKLKSADKEKMGINSLVVSQIKPDYLVQYNNSLQISPRVRNEDVIIHLPSFEFKHRILKAVLRHLDSSKIKCTFHVENDLWATRVNRKTVSTIVENLFLNAIESIENQGNLEITVQNLDKKNDETWSFKHERYVEISITDDGCGISKENSAKIFIPFFTTKKTHTGMGLNIVQKLLQLNEGFMKIYSEPCEGTFVKVYLPVSF